MAIEIFTWSPRVNPQQTVNFRVRKAQFGDGYAQVSGDGINTRSQDWELSFVGTEDYIRPIKQFLDRHAGTRAFQWTPPLEEVGFTAANNINRCRWAAEITHFQPLLFRHLNHEP
jgi:phage-related protein